MMIKITYEELLKRMVKLEKRIQAIEVARTVIHK